jgi:hypothetical protein
MWQSAPLCGVHARGCGPAGDEVSETLDTAQVSHECRLAVKLRSGSTEQALRRKEDDMNIIQRSIAGALCVLIASPVLQAQATAPPQMESFTGTTVNLHPGAGIRLQINVFKWATETERDALLSVLTDKSASGLGAALEKAPTIGYIWDGGHLGYSLRYAHRVAQPDGGERIILLTDRPLGSWGREAWKPSGQAPAGPYSFTLVELRLTKDGQGHGKMSLAARITADTDAKTVTLENYAAAPVLIDGVKRVVSNT